MSESDASESHCIAADSSPASPSPSPTPDPTPEDLELEIFGRIQGILTHRKPYCSGTLDVDKDQLVLFYGKDAKTAGRIDFSDTTNEELQHLLKTCEQATFGVNQESVLDEQYRKSRKLDTAHFSPLFDVNGINLTGLLRREFLPDKLHDVDIRIARYKLNVYEPGSFFKPHVDTPRGGNMFGSLVIVFPTPHEGGALVLRDAGKEWTVDAAHDIASNPELCVAFAAFYGDVEHEVLPVTSGYRVTMTYNLYYERTPPLKYIRTNVNEPYEQLKAVLEEMLAHPQILPDGGYLGFGLQRQYGLSEDTDLSTLVQNLKGSDALLMTVCDDLSIDVSVRMLYSGDDGYDVLAHQIYDIGHETVEEYPYADYIIQNDSEAFRVNTDKRDKDSKMPMIRWVVGNIKLGYVSQTISTYGNEPSLDQMYGHVCLIITIGPHGDRQNIDNLPQRDDDDNDYY